jgi:ATP-dependent HslUV protease ATP-binding subunit HslU
LTRQYGELLATEGVQVEYTQDGIEALADIAFEVNRTTQNIGARRLQTIMERVVEEVSFEGPDLSEKKVKIDGGYVRSRLEAIMEKEDLSRFIL